MGCGPAVVLRAVYVTITGGIWITPISAFLSSVDGGMPLILRVGSVVAYGDTMSEASVPSPELHERLVRVEDAVQEFRFVHMVRTDAHVNGMGALYAGQQRLEHTLAGFRAEVTVELETVKADLAAVRTEQARQGAELDEIKAEQARHGEILAEVLRRLS